MHNEKIHNGNFHSILLNNIMYILLKQTKKQILETFKNENTALRILFATVSLGMGADLQDVDFVFNVGPPTTVESKSVIIE